MGSSRVTLPSSNCIIHLPLCGGEGGGGKATGLSVDVIACNSGFMQLREGKTSEMDALLPLRPSVRMAQTLVGYRARFLRN